MLIELDFSSDKPIYEQLYECIIISMAKGHLKAGDSLPSVRALAEEIGINLHTVNKTYNLLKEEGYVNIDRRKGAIINNLPICSLEKAEASLSEPLTLLIAKAHLMGIDETTFSALCKQYFKNYKGDLS